MLPARRWAGNRALISGRTPFRPGPALLIPSCDPNWTDFPSTKRPISLQISVRWTWACRRKLFSNEKSANRARGSGIVTTRKQRLCSGDTLSPKCQRARKPRLFEQKGRKSRFFLSIFFARVHAGSRSVQPALLDVAPRLLPQFPTWQVRKVKARRSGGVVPAKTGLLHMPVPQEYFRSAAFTRCVPV